MVGCDSLSYSLLKWENGIPAMTQGLPPLESSFSFLGQFQGFPVKAVGAADSMLSNVEFQHKQLNDRAGIDSL